MRERSPKRGRANRAMRARARARARGDKRDACSLQEGFTDLVNENNARWGERKERDTEWVRSQFYIIIEEIFNMFLLSVVTG